MRPLTDIRIREVPNRNLIPTGAQGVFYVEDEDQIVVRF